MRTEMDLQDLRKEDVTPCRGIEHVNGFTLTELIAPIADAYDGGGRRE